MGHVDQAPIRETLPTTGAVKVTPLWVGFFQALVDALNGTASREATVAKTAQSAAIAATSVTSGTLAPGLYRVSYYARITQAATTSSSLTVTLAWTDGGVACSESGAAMTGNTTSTQQTGSRVIRVDSATQVTYATAYASSGATPMQYALSVVLESLPA